MIKYEHLLGVQYEIGSKDCYSIIRDFFQDNFQIHLRDYARPDQWWTQGLNLYYDNFMAEGFEIVDVPLQDLQVGDVLLMAMQSSFPNHCAVYVGQGKIIHHMYRQLSRQDAVRGVYRNTLVAVLRHRQVPPIDREYNLLDLSSL